MPQQETWGLNERAVLWAATGRYDNQGQATVGSPVEIPVRWNSVVGETEDPQDNTNAVTATAVVAQVIPLGSRMWLGTLSQWVGTGIGSGADVPNNLCEVKTYDETMDVNCRNPFRTVGLMRFRDTP